MNDSLLMVGGYTVGGHYSNLPDWLETIWDYEVTHYQHYQPSKKYLKEGITFQVLNLVHLSHLSFGCWTMLNQTTLEPGKPFFNWSERLAWWLGLCQLRISRSSLLVLLRCKSRLGHWEPCLKLSISDDFCTFRGYFAVILYTWKPLFLFRVFSVMFCQFTRDISLAMANPRRCQASRVFVQGEEEICIGDVATLELRMGFLVSIPGNLCHC